jgi:hypothetical protein
VVGAHGLEPEEDVAVKRSCSVDRGDFHDLRRRISVSSAKRGPRTLSKLANMMRESVATAAAMSEQGTSRAKKKAIVAAGLE